MPTGERLHGDDTKVPVLAKGKTVTGRAWVYVRDDRPFASADPLAAPFFFWRDRSGKHLEQHLADISGNLQADAGACPRAGYNGLYGPNRQPQQQLRAPLESTRVLFELGSFITRWESGRDMWLSGKAQPTS